MSWFHQHSIHSSNGYWDNQSLGNENFDETCWLQLKETGNILTFHISGTQKIKLNRLNWRRNEFLSWIRWEINISKLTVINVCLWQIRWFSCLMENGRCQIGKSSIKMSLFCVLRNGIFFNCSIFQDQMEISDWHLPLVFCILIKFLPSHETLI